MFVSFWFDLDGTITVTAGKGVSEKNVPWQIIWVTLFFYRPKTNAWIVKIMQGLKENGFTVNIITSRPKELENLTLHYLKKHNVPYDNIFFLGTGQDAAERKVDKVAESKGRFKFIFDNNKKVIQKARKKGIVAFLIQNQE